MNILRALIFQRTWLLFSLYFQKHLHEVLQYNTNSQCIHVVQWAHTHASWNHTQYVTDSNSPCFIHTAKGFTLKVQWIHTHCVIDSNSMVIQYPKSLFYCQLSLTWISANGGSDSLSEPWETINPNPQNHSTTQDLCQTPCHGKERNVCFYHQFTQLLQNLMNGREN